MQGTDILCIDDGIYKIKGDLIKSNNTHGTGCTYSSSITCELINNKTILDAAINSKNYVKESIKQGYYNTPNQFWKK